MGPIDKKNIVFVFDMDGVIVNTIKRLYSVYCNFVYSFSKEVDLTDLAKLNGFKIAQIIAFAKAKYQIPGTEEELIKQYLSDVGYIYSKAPLIDNVETVLKDIKNDGFKIALASSAKKDQIDLVLKRFNLGEYFGFIASGDDVIRAKPFPDIYACVRDHFGDKEYYVIEDSANGITAADSAGMNVIFFNQNNKKYNPIARYMFTRMDKFDVILKEITKIKGNPVEIKSDYKTIIGFNNVILNTKQCELDITLPQEEIVNQNWNEERIKNNKLFNGVTLCYGSHHLIGTDLMMECFPVEYKYILAQLKGKIDFNLRPLAVSGLIIDQQKNTLISKRSNTVTQFKSYYEFVPSGGIPGDSINSKSIQDQLAIEFEEETNLNPKLIKRINPFCLISDQKTKVYDVCCLIEVRGDLQSLIKSDKEGEYMYHQLININQVEHFLNNHVVVPTSLIMYDIFKKKINFN